MKRYDSYKDSGIEWIGEIPGHWEEVRIKQLAIGDNTLFLDGDWIESKEIVFDEDNIRYITTGNIGEGKYKEQGSGYITEETFEKLNCTEVYPGDMLISRLNPPIGRACIIPDLGKRVVTSVDNVILRPNGKYSKDFLVHFFSNSKYFEFTMLEGRGATMQRISRSILGNIKIVVPNTIAEQTAIARYLDRKTAELDELIADKKRLLGLYEEEKTAIINQAVTKGLHPDVPMKDSGIEWLGEVPGEWGVKKVKHVLKSLNSIRVPLSAEERGKMLNREYDYYGASGVIDKVENHLFDEPLLLIGEDGANLVTRNTRLSFIASGKYWVNNHAHILKPKFGVLEYYCELMELCDYSIWISGSAQPKLTSENLMNIQIIVPSEEEQQSIVHHIQTECARIDAKKAKTEKLIELLAEYRTALISEVVTGKVKVVE
jgi:type I restriction enzyme, S subunit